MKTPILLFLASGAAMVRGDFTLSNPATSVAASSVLSNAFGSFIPTQATGAVATSLASAVYSVQTSYYKGPASSDYSAIWTAAAKATNSPSVVASIGLSGWNWGVLTTQAWYTANVPASVQTDVENYFSAINSVANSVLLTSISKADAAGPKCTGMAMAAAAGVAGVAAAVLL